MPNQYNPNGRNNCHNKVFFLETLVIPVRWTEHHIKNIQGARQRTFDHMQDQINTLEKELT